MEAKKFYVEMDNPSLFFFPGDSVTGRIIVNYQNPKQTKGISAKFTGLVRARWEERYGRGRVRIIREKDICFDETVNVAGNGTDEMTLEPGRNTFPFDFTLPNELPSTFFGTFGYITYSMVALMKRNGKADKIVSVWFTINEVVDLNRGMPNSLAKMPMEEQKEKMVSSFFRKSGPVSFKLKIPRCGFVPGETIPIVVDLYNNSRKKITKTEIGFFQEIIYHAENQKRLQHRFLIHCIGPTIGPGGSKTWRGINFPIPPIPPSSLKSTLIDIKYYLKLDLEISGMSSPLSGKYLIVIGNVPMQNTFGELSQKQEGLSKNDIRPPDYDNVDLFSVSKSATIFQTYPDLPPPTYAEAVGFHPGPYEEISNETGAENSSDFKNYVPKYITYGHG